MTTQRDDLFRQVLHLWGSFWRFEPQPGEIKTLLEATSTWPSLAPLTAALRHATETLDERPSVAWLIREARRRLPERTTDTATLCPECLDEGWVKATAQRQPGALRPCPECRPLQAELWTADTYAIDTPSMGGRGDGNPTAQAIIDKHRAGGSPAGKRVLMAREPAMTETSREYLQSLARANHLVGMAKRDRHTYLVGLARNWRVELPTMPIGDEAAVRRAVEVLRAKGAEVSDQFIDIPTPEQYLRGADIPRPPTAQQERLGRGILPRSLGGSSNDPDLY